MTGMPRKSAAILWVLCPVLLLLSSIRPPNASSERAKALPASIAGFQLKRELTITPNMRRLLGTRDVGWRVYVDDNGNELFVTIVFHDSNWKSLHPPHICIRGSNFSINTDRSVWNELPDGRKFDLGHIVATKENKPNQDYVSLYAFVGQDFITPSYTWFYLNHWMPALLRQTTPGFLLRVEAFVGRDGQAATEQRCLKMFKAFLPFAETLIRLE